MSTKRRGATDASSAEKAPAAVGKGDAAPTPDEGVRGSINNSWDLKGRGFKPRRKKAN